MTPSFYHFLHIAGLIVLFAGLGSLLSGDEKARKRGGMLHGIGLLIMLIAAFGFIAKSNKPNVVISYGSVYVMVKGLIWLVLGFLPVVAKKKWLSPGAVLVVAILVGITAAYIGYFKPLPTL